MQVWLDAGPCNTEVVLRVARDVMLDTVFNQNPLLVRFSAVSCALSQSLRREAEVDVGPTFAG